jgi:hypothetical protein
MFICAACSLSVSHYIITEASLPYFGFCLDNICLPEFLVMMVFIIVHDCSFVYIDQLCGLR